MTKRTMSGADWAILLILSVLWGGSFFFIEVVLETVAPLTLVLIRVAIAAALLWAWLLLRRERMKLPPGAALALLVLALLNNVVPFILFAWAQEEITGGLASILERDHANRGVIVAQYQRTRETAAKIAGGC